MSFSTLADDTVRPLAAVLPRLDPEIAATRTALIAGLHGCTVDALLLAAAADEPAERELATWIGFATRIGPVAIAPRLADGLAAAMDAGPGRPDAVAAGATLGRLEPLVAALERVLGAELHPDSLAKDLSTLLPAGAVTVAIDAATNGIARHRLLLAVPPRTRVTPLLRAAPPRPPAGMRLRWRGQIVGPVIAASRIASLGEGDLILLGAGRSRIRLLFPGGIGGRIGEADLPAGTVRLTGDILGEDATMESVAGERTVDDAAAIEPGHALQLPTLIEFDGGAISLADIAGLNAGSVLPLPAAGGTLPVRVLAGGARIAEGELVAIGDGFGILVTRTTSATAGG